MYSNRRETASDLFESQLKLHIYERKGGCRTTIQKTNFSTANSRICQHERISKEQRERTVIKRAIRDHTSFSRAFNGVTNPVAVRFPFSEVRRAEVETIEIPRQFFFLLLSHDIVVRGRVSLSRETARLAQKERQI